MYFELEIVTRDQLATSQKYHQEPDVIDAVPSALDTMELAVQRERLRKLLQDVGCHNSNQLNIADDEVLIGVECYFHWSRNSCGFFNGKGPRKVHLELDGLDESVVSEDPVTPNQKKMAKLAEDIASLFRIGTRGI